MFNELSEGEEGSADEANAANYSNLYGGIAGDDALDPQQQDTISISYTTRMGVDKTILITRSTAKNIGYQTAKVLQDIGYTPFAHEFDDIFRAIWCTDQGILIFIYYYIFYLYIYIYI